ncbi:hypothetical protein [Azospirillum endophyticum]
MHLAGTCSAGPWHRDAQATRRQDRITVWLPFTNCRDGATLRRESGYGRADCRPYTNGF